MAGRADGKGGKDDKKTTNREERTLRLTQALPDEMPPCRDTQIPAFPEHRWRLLA